MSVWPGQLAVIVSRGANAVQWRCKRLWRTTLGRRPYEAKPTIANARRLMGNPSETELEQVGTILDSVLARPDPPSRGTLQLIVDHAIAVLRESNNEVLATDRVRRAANEHPQRALTETRRFIEHLRDTNRRDAASALARQILTSTGEPGYGTILHRLQLGKGDIDAARQTAADVAATLPKKHPTPLMMRAEELLASDDLAGALTELNQIKARFSAAYSRRLTRALTGLGDHEAVLKYLDTYDSGLSEIDERMRRFDAYFSLGERELAEAQLAGVGDDEPDERFVSRLAKAFGLEAAGAHLVRLAETTPGVDPSSEELEQTGIVLFRSNRPREAVETLRSADRMSPLTPPALQALAQSLYSIRAFDETLIEIDRLSDTERHWAAMKLKGRVFIQLGQPAQAIKNRQQYGRPDDDTDQVHYHALLSLGRYDEAFRLHPFANDLRSLRIVFGDRAETSPKERVNSRFIIADAGPGDDIQDASLFAELQHVSGRLSSTCDPRMHTLLARSFPNIEFIPVERLRRPPYFASHGPAAEARSGNALDRLLTVRAFESASTHDRVVLGRAIKNVRDLSQGPRAQPAFLQPDPDRAQGWRTALAADRPSVGLVWRSELQTSWRAVNYLTAADLAPLATIDATFVCLQHDITDAERSSLVSTFGDRVRFEESTNLRDDFEEAAALVSALELMIGVGTTMTNLAAAVGCPTLMMHPTHFGSWLAADSKGSDFWYQSCTVVVVAPPYDTSQLINRTTALASTKLENKSRFAS